MQHHYYFLEGGGELGALTRAHDWSSSSLGMPDTWPAHLRTTVSVLLNSRFPMFLWWGPDMIQFYNDAYRPSLGVSGKHPAALGQRGEDCWPEIWETIYPMIRQVQLTGEATWNEDMLVPIYRNGQIEEVYWTFGYSPVKGETSIDGVLVVCTETTEKVKYVRALDESKQELEFAIEASELGTWDLSPATMAFSANGRLREWFGLTEQDDVNLSVALQAIVPEDLWRVKTAITGVLAGEGNGKYDIEYTIVHPGTGLPRTVRAKGKAVFDATGACIRFNGTLQDITEQRKASERVELLVAERTLDLKKANAELEKSNAQLSQFAYIASHDLQEPLRKVNVFTQMLEEHLAGSADEKTAQFMGRITDAAGRSMSLIRDILAYSRIPGPEELAFSDVDLHALLQKVLVDFDLQIEQKNAVINIGQVPVVTGNWTQLSQFFANLLSNALKFCHPNRRPVINISAYQRTPSNDDDSQALPEPYLEIVFADNGIGFDPAFREKIFNIFHRLWRHSEYEGTGIGLALSRRIAENHNGKVYAESVPGHGATFHLLLPIKGAKSERADL